MSTNPQAAEAYPVAELGVVTSPWSRYAAALIQIATALLGAFVILPADTFTRWETGVPAGLGMLSIALGAVGTYVVPLLGARESAILKVSVAVAAGVVAAVIDFVARGDFSPVGLGFLALAILSGLGTQIGVEVRKDAAAPGART